MATLGLEQTWKWNTVLASELDQPPSLAKVLQTTGNNATNYDQSCFQRCPMMLTRSVANITQCPKQAFMLQCKNSATIATDNEETGCHARGHG
jgi:hypothetical protein